MIVLEGQPALSPFRRERLEARLQPSFPTCASPAPGSPIWSSPSPGASPDLAALQRILEAGSAAQPLAAGAVSRFVVPRLGTISPWASKATEMLHGAGLPVKRVERGLRIDLGGWPHGRGHAGRAGASCCTTR